LQADATLYGAGPRSFHRTNVALHALNAVLLFCTLARLTGRIELAAVVALLFAVHPLRVESVAWVSERKDVLSTCFGLLALFVYAGRKESLTFSRVAVVSALFALSLLAKPMLVTLPLLLLVLDWWPLGRMATATDTEKRAWLNRFGRLAREKIPLLALAAVSCWVTWLAQRRSAAASLELVPFSARIGNAVVSYATYLVQTVYPVDLAPFYPLPSAGPPIGQVFASALALFVVSGLAVGQARARPYLLAGWLWYLGLLVPVIGLVQVGPQARADRYTYLPAVGIYLMAVWRLDELAARFRLRAAASALAVATAVVLVLLCRRQVTVWHDDYTLWQRTLDVSGENWLARYGLGIAEERAGHTQTALEDYEMAVQLNPRNATLLARLGAALHARGQFREARDCYEKALAVDPNYAQAHANLGAALRSLGDPKTALEHLQTAVALEPDEPESAPAYFNLGAIFEEKGDRAEAIRAFRHAVALEPSNPRYKARLDKLERPER
jgi:tetratricopeptide (TPR) repeat protein